MSKVVIVATDNDQIAKKSKERDRINEAIDQLYAKKYPEIVAVEFVACTKRKKDFADTFKLTQTLCDIATKIEISSGMCYLFVHYACYFISSSSNEPDEPTCS